VFRSAVTSSTTSDKFAIANSKETSFGFGPYRLDPAKRLLSRDGRSLALPPKTFDLLLLFVASRGRVLTKKELMNALWSDTFVEEANLSFQISALRKVLDEEGREWIETLPRYGYRFNGEVSEIDLNLRSDADVQVAPEKREPASTNGARVANSETGPKAAARVPFFTRTTTVPVALASLVAMFFAVMYLRETQPLGRLVSFQIPSPEGVVISDLDSISMSPDGERLTFIGRGSDSKRLLSSIQRAAVHMDNAARAALRRASGVKVSLR